MGSANNSAPEPVPFSPGLIARLGPGQARLAGPSGHLPIPAYDKATLKLAMLYEGHCAGLGATQAAAKFGYSRQGYYKVLQQFRDSGAGAFFQRTGPKTNYRRGEPIVRAVIQHRFHDPEAPAAEVARQLRLDGLRTSARSVERIIAEYGLRRRSYPKTRAGSGRPATGCLGTAAPAGATANGRTPAGKRLEARSEASSTTA